MGVILVCSQNERFSMAMDVDPRGTEQRRIWFWGYITDSSSLLTCGTAGSDDRRWLFHVTNGVFMTSHLPGLGNSPRMSRKLVALRMLEPTIFSAEDSVEVLETNRSDWEYFNTIVIDRHNAKIEEYQIDVFSATIRCTYDWFSGEAGDTKAQSPLCGKPTGAKQIKQYLRVENESQLATQNCCWTLIMFWAVAMNICWLRVRICCIPIGSNCPCTVSGSITKSWSTLQMCDLTELVEAFVVLKKRALEHGFLMEIENFYLVRFSHALRNWMATGCVVAFATWPFPAPCSRADTAFAKRRPAAHKLLRIWGKMGD